MSARDRMLEALALAGDVESLSARKRKRSPGQGGAG
jgi:hypothetical protein